MKQNVSHLQKEAIKTYNCLINKIQARNQNQNQNQNILESKAVYLGLGIKPYYRRWKQSLIKKKLKSQSPKIKV